MGGLQSGLFLLRPFIVCRDSVLSACPMRVSALGILSILPSEYVCPYKSNFIGYAGIALRSKYCRKVYCFNTNSATLLPESSKEEQFQVSLPAGVRVQM